MSIVYQLLTDKEDDAIAIDLSGRPGDRAIERGALGNLELKELASIFNALVPKEEQIVRFADKASAVRRVLAAIDAAVAIPDVAPPEAKAKRSRAKPKPVPKVERKRGALGRPNAAMLGTLHLTPAAVKKVWHKGSARYAAYKVIEDHKGISLVKFHELVGKGSKGLLAKILETGTVEIRE